MNLGTATVIRGDARRLPLPDDSVDLIVTSPPYFALRSYQDNGEHYDGQIGSEATPVEFLDALIGCTREWMRVLKPSGSLWVNLGDKYNSAAGPRSGTATRANIGGGTKWYESQRGAGHAAVPIKSLMGIPWRYALRCIDELGLILRAEVIWSKPNGLPESVTDRVRRSHETWFHFTLQPRYFSAVDEVRDGYAADTAKRYAAGYNARTVDGQRLSVGTKLGGDTYGENPLGKLPGSVREIPTEPLTVPDHLGVDHFAAFPTAWPKWIIQGWSPAGICTGCGDGRRPVVDKRLTNVWHDKPPQLTKFAGQSSAHLNGRKADGNQMMQTFGSTEATITGYTCACPTPDAPTRPAVIVDPFGGTGTTALAAKALGRHGISIDLSMDYSRLAKWRTTDPGQLAKVLGIDKPPVQTIGQIDLFGGAA